jgi:ATP-dependent DNA ligase
MRGSIWPFQFGSKRYRPLGGEDDEGQNNSKSHRSCVIEPLQCKPVTALPAGENWIFEIKFDGYRCIASP